MSKKTRKKRAPNKALEKARPEAAANGPAPAQRPVTHDTPLTKAGGIAGAILWGCLLAVPVLLRPWRDGMTYPGENAYFTAAVVVWFGVFAARQLMHGNALRNRALLLLVAGYGVVALALVPASYQFDNTYRSLLNWATYAMLVTVVAGGGNRRRTFWILLSAFLVTAFAEAVWSLLHYQFVLPYIRQAVTQNPLLLRRYLSVDTMSDEFLHRMNVNRAFGSLLFPNALAAFMLVAAPATLGVLVYCASSLRQALSGKAGPAGGNRLAALFVGVGTWAASFMAFSFILLLVTGFARPGEPWTRHWPMWIIASILAPAALGLLGGGLAARRGHGTCLLLGATCALAVSLPLQLLSLWITYSRGGMIAFAAAAAVGLALFLGAGPLRRFAPAAALAVTLLAGVLLAASGEAAPGVPAPDPPTGQQLGASPAGLEVTAEDLRSTATFLLRVEYWRVGWRMALDNALTGVGLGNFGAAYPKYQAVGQPPVQAAHNDYLQAFSETGILGALVFAALWVYAAVAGARRVLGRKGVAERALAAGLYTGMLAFALHALVDFNFENPTLAFFAFLVTGLLFARTIPPGKPPGNERVRSGLQFAGLGMLILTAVVAGATARVWAFDWLLKGGDLAALKNPGTERLVRQLSGARFLLNAAGAEEPGPGDQPPMEALFIVSETVPSLERLQDFGMVLLPVPTGGMRRLGRHERLSPEEFDRAVFAVQDKEAARRAAMDFSELWIESYAQVDDLYPHMPMVADVLFNWNDVLHSNAEDQHRKRQLALACLRWAEEAVARSPQQSIYHVYLGKALLMRGGIERGPRAQEYFDAGFASYRRAIELYPSSPQPLNLYAAALEQMGRLFTRSGREEQGEQYLRQAREARRRAEEIRAAGGV